VTDTKPTTAPPATSALVSVAQGIEYNLDAFPTARYNRLSPIQTIRMPSDLFVPIVQVVQLDPADGQGKSADHYSSSDTPAGHRALTARGLNKVATAASVSFYDERRSDDGSDPNVIGVTVMASMLLPSGQRVTAPGSQMIDLSTWFGKDASAQSVAKFRKQFYAHVSTRAKNRAIRGLLSLRSSYPDADIVKPFAVFSIVPNMNHPEVRARIIEAMAPSVAQLYGPAPAPQLAAGQPDIQAPEAPEDDGVIDGQATDAGPEPSWFGTTVAAPEAAAPTQTPAMRLAAILREKAASSGMVGPATAPQKERLQLVFKPLGLPATAVGLRIVFGLASLGDITAAQAQAVIECAVDAEFGDLWRELVAGAQAG
jgi:hypothetical protein